MEHLHLPKNLSIPGPDYVPYVCTEDYDGGPFLTYPIRQGKSYILEAASEQQYRAVVIPMPTAELEAFVQTWLFFGLLKEILGDRCSTSQFISISDSPSPAPPRRLNTNLLGLMVKDWLNHVVSSDKSKDEKQAQYDHIAECLQLTLRVLNALRYSWRPDLNRQMIASIASVAELLEAATNQAYGIENFASQNKCPGTWAHFLRDDPRSTELMKRHGYCPSEVHRIRNTFMMLSTTYFLTYMDRVDPVLNHEHCNDHECLSLVNNLGPREVKHRTKDCYCCDTTVDVAKVIAIIFRGGLPLLRLFQTTLNDDIRLEIVEASPLTKYVAISHVWSDGLGNPKSNSLPKCQLQHLLDLVSPFVGAAVGEENSAGMLIWLDTLLVPISPPEIRTMAINQMQRPYTEAAFVLVLDSSLYKIPSLELDSIEKGLLIFTTRWMRRLWTLQEGALANTLYFQFKDAAVDLRELSQEVIDIYNSDIQRRYLALDVATANGKLRNFFYAYADGVPNAGPDLANAVKALQYRSVSVATDEPLLLAGLLQLDTSHILDGPESSRMQRLWTSMPLVPGGIPANIIFRPEPKLSQLGFRWAAQTFLNCKDRHAVSLGTGDSEHHATSLTPAGLEVRFAGLRIELPTVPEGLPRNPWNLRRGINENDIFCRYPNGTWFHMTIDDLDTRASTSNLGMETLHSMLGDRLKRYAVILSRPIQFDNSNLVCAGLLVHYADENEAIPIVHSNVLVNISIKLGAIGVLFEAAWLIAQVFLENELTSQFTSLGIHDEDQQKQDPAYSTLIASFEQKLRLVAGSIREGPLHDVLQAYNQHTNAYVLFQAVIVTFYLGHYASSETMLPSDTRWCVD